MFFCLDRGGRGFLLGSVGWGFTGLALLLFSINSQVLTIFFKRVYNGTDF